MHSYFSYLTYNSLSPFYVFSVICKLSFVAHSMLFLLLRLGGIEKKPRPKKAFLVKFWHWNLNGLAAHDFVKILRILKKLCGKTTHNSDIICLFETFWIPQYSKMIKKNNINDHSLLTVHHPSNNKRGGGSLYYKDCLPLIAKNDFSIMQEY